MLEVEGNYWGFSGCHRSAAVPLLGQRGVIAWRFMVLHPLCSCLLPDSLWCLAPPATRRFEAHQRLGREMILCRVRKATRQVSGRCAGVGVSSPRAAPFALASVAGVFTSACILPPNPHPTPPYLLCLLQILKFHMM